MADEPHSGDSDDGKAKTPKAEADLSHRLSELDARLVKLRSETRQDAPGGFAKEGANYGRALRHLSEFVGGVAAGLLLGWLVDLATGFSPVGLVVGLVLGFVTGFWNIYKSSLRTDGR